MSYPSLGIGIVLAFGWWVSLTTALAESRHALVIGNSAYQTVPALPNPANDARAITEFLKSAGFEVTSVNNLTLGDMRQAISQFADTLAGALFSARTRSLKLSPPLLDTPRRGGS